MPAALNGPKVLAPVTCTNAAAAQIMSGDESKVRRKALLLTCEGAACRIGDGGSGALLSATVGTPLAVGEKMVLEFELGDCWYVIGQSASTTTLQVTVIR